MRCLNNNKGSDADGRVRRAAERSAGGVVLGVGAHQYLRRFLRSATYEMVEKTICG